VFGCGEPLRTLSFGDDFADSLLGAPESARLRRIDSLNRSQIDAYFTERGRSRRQIIKAGGLLGLLSTAASWFTPPRRASASGAPPPNPTSPVGEGRRHVVPSTLETVKSGVFDATLPNIVEIESGDHVVYPDTWTHWLNQLQPDLTVDDILKLRSMGGGHSIVGPVGVKGADIGDVIAIRFERLAPIEWGVNYSNPGYIGTGTLPQDFPQGNVNYFDLDVDSMTTAFAPGITLPLTPFQGVFAVAPVDGGVTSSVPPGPYGGNMDLRELTEGSTLYLPVWLPGAKLYTGDSHALQGDGEVNITAVETAMREVRVSVTLHKQAAWTWPFAETDNHWIALGTDPDLNEALRIALRNAIDFLELRAGLTRLDAYSLASIAVNFRITQSVDVNKGVHAMIPKSIFSDELRSSISIVS
jgi:acetamidase/formamidase